jgi:hypothetical protein
LPLPSAIKPDQSSIVGVSATLSFALRVSTSL